MSGYKRVNFYELCRLCATNQQKEKTHIFTEEGRKIQLQNKIQSCLSLNVCETDCLPKVVCSKCLRSLEVCYTFRQECVTSESMLSTYFKNFRYTDDFKKSGKVYIKDTTTKSSPEHSPTVSTAGVTTAVINNVTYAQPAVEAKPATISQPTANQSSQHLEPIPFYTLQLPTIVTNQQILEKTAVQKATEISQPKIIQNTTNTPQMTYNLNTINSINLSALKTAVQAVPPKLNETMSNVVVNANGEVINIAQLVDFESLINQTTVMPKVKTHKASRRVRDVPKEVHDDTNIIKIDLTESDNQGNYDTGQAHQMKYDKLPHIKSTQNDKYTYTIKVDDSKQQQNVNPTVIFNTMTNYQQPAPSSNANFTTYTNNVYQSPSINLVNTTANSLVTPNICAAPSIEPASTVNLSALSQSIQEVGQAANQTYRSIQQPITQNNYTNVISSIPSSTHNSGNNNHSSNNNNNNSNTKSTAKFSLNQGNISVNAIHVPVTITNSIVTTNNAPNNNNNNSNSHNSNGSNAVREQIQKLHACEICQKTFKRKEHLYQHIKLHTGFRPYACENCNKSFMRKEHLLRHMTSHSGQKNFQCNICEKSFSRNDNLLKHRKTHDKQSTYSCEVCNKQFVMKHYYMVHKLTHDEDKCNNICVLKA